MLRLLKRFFDLFKKPEIIKPPEKPIPHVGYSLWYPKATFFAGMKTHGEYKDKYPSGAVVHYTAGHDTDEIDAMKTCRGGIENGFAFFVIGPTGKVYQSVPLNRYGYHAGESYYEGIGDYVSSDLVGIEVCCAGKLDGNKSWFGKEYPPEEIRHVPERDFGSQAGNYKKFTEAQEKSLIELLVWLKQNNPSVFRIDRIVGHHTVSPKRKSDPGGSLSYTIPELRFEVSKRIVNG